MGNLPLSVPPQDPARAAQSQTCEPQGALPLKAMRHWVVALLLGLALLVVLWPRPAWGVATEDATSLGANLFANHCAACHVNGGNIIRRSQTLQLKALQRRGLASAEAIAAVAANGLGQMGGYGEALGPGGADLVGLWVWQQAQKAWIQG